MKEGKYVYSASAQIQLNKAHANSDVIGELLIMIGFMTFYIPQGYSVSQAGMIAWKLSAIMVSIFSGLSMLTFSLISKRYIAVAAYYFWFFVGTRFTSAHGQIKLAQFLISTGYFAYLEVLLHTKPLRTVMRDYIAAGVIMLLIHFASFAYVEITGNIYFYGRTEYYAGHSIFANNI